MVGMRGAGWERGLWGRGQRVDREGDGEGEGMVCGLD